jgi:hypothetical protein
MVGRSGGARRVAGVGRDPWPGTRWVAAVVLNRKWVTATARSQPQQGPAERLLLAEANRLVTQAEAAVHPARLASE